MRQREPQFHHEIKPIAVDFQMFHLQELLGVKSLHSEILCGTRDIPEKKKVTHEPMTMYHDLEVFCYIRACQACCGQKCVLILFRNVIIVACLLFLLL